MNLTKRKGTKVIEKLRNNNKMRRIISNMLIILGVLLIVGIITVNVRDIRRSVKSVEEFKQTKEAERIIGDTSLPDEDTDSELTEDETDVHEETALEEENTDTDDIEQGTTYVKRKGGELICLLRIPKISLEEAVREGDSRDVLSSALCHLEYTSYPGKTGNCCISGHRNYTFGKYFNRLEEIAVGDIIELETFENVYRYQVYETLVVTPDNVTVLDSNSAKTLTLITCTPLFVGTHRFIVKAILVE